MLTVAISGALLLPALFVGSVAARPAHPPVGTATLTIVKQCIPVDDPGLFNLRVDGVTLGAPDRGCSAGNAASGVVNAGRRKVSETAGTNTSLANYTAVISGACNARGEVTIVGGVDATCYITNTRKATATLTIVKQCLPIADPGLFNLRVDGVTLGAPDRGCQAGNAASGVVNAGLHKVSEAAGTGTSLANYTALISGACAANGSITIVGGVDATCYITNTRKPTLTVNKVCVPDLDPGLFDLLIDGHKKGVDDVSCAQGGNRTTGPVALSVGTHRVSEQADGTTDLADYTATFSDDCDEFGMITLAAGENKTCTITNTRKATTTTLTIEKICVGAPAEARFTLQIDQVTQLGNAQCGDITDPLDLSPGGTYTVGEIAGTDTNLDDYDKVFGGACDPLTGVVTLLPGENATCTITNSLKPKLTLQKFCSPSDDTHLFVLQIDASDVGSPVSCNDAAFTVSVDPGSHTVGERAGVGTNLLDYTASFNGACNATTGAVTLAYGDAKSCGIINTYVPASLVLDPTLAGVDGLWGYLTGSGLSPGATVYVCSDRPGVGCFAPVATVDVSGNLGPAGPHFSCDFSLFAVYFKTSRLSGSEIVSNSVSTSPCPV
jgi:hypothetical protein